MAKRAKILAQGKKNSSETESPLSKRAEISKGKQRKLKYKKLNRRQKAEVERIELQEARKAEQADGRNKPTSPGASFESRQPKQRKITHSPKPTDEEEKTLRIAQQTPSEEKAATADLPNMKENPEAVRARAKSLKPPVRLDKPRYHLPTATSPEMCG